VNTEISTGKGLAIIIAAVAAIALMAVVLTHNGSNARSGPVAVDGGSLGETTTSTEPEPDYGGKLGDKHFALQSLSVKDDGLGDIGGTARVTNVGAQPYTATYTITFFKPRTSTVIGTAEGSAEDVQPGQTVTLQLVSQDPLPSTAFTYDFQVDTEF
jgi:hypothetical protein